MKKIIVFAITLSLLLSVMLVAVGGEATDGEEDVKESEIEPASFGGGSGTESDPYLIEDVHQLQNISNDLTAHYELANDIDANETKGWNDGRGFKPIGGLQNPFNGSLDGQGHDINGLYMNKENHNEAIGLFSRLGEGVVIENLNLIDAEVIVKNGSKPISVLSTDHYSTDHYKYGSNEIRNVNISGEISVENDIEEIVVGDDDPIAISRVGPVSAQLIDGALENVHTDVDIYHGVYNYNESYDYNIETGGILGAGFALNERVFIKNSSSTGTITVNSSEHSVGGITGGGICAVIENSYSEMKINGAIYNATSYPYGVGGLAPGLSRPGGYYPPTEIYDSYFAGTIDVETEVPIGGIVGYAEGGAIERTYFAGDILQGTNVGGIAADFVEENATCVDSYYNDRVETSACGEIKSTEEMTYPYENNTYENWDFTNTWLEGDHELVEDHKGNTGYPALQWQVDPEEYELTINIDGQGSTVPSEGSHTYENGTVVTVEATPAEGWSFAEWTGDASGTDRTIEITMDSNKSITAVFEEEVGEYYLEINIDGQGSTDPSEGSHPYQEGDVVTVEATPAEGWYFEEWTGDATGTDSTINITMDENKSITANFEESVAVGTYILMINIEGNGTVEVDGEEVEDGWTGEFEEGTTVTLEAISGENWTFEEWTGNYGGNISEQEEEITITMDENKSITANFVEFEEDGDGGGTPGFTTMILLVAVVTAIAIYRKKKG